MKTEITAYLIDIAKTYQTKINEIESECDSLVLANKNLLRELSITKNSYNVLQMATYEIVNENKDGELDQMYTVGQAEINALKEEVIALKKKLNDGAYEKHYTEFGEDFRCK